MTDREKIAQIIAEHLCPQGKAHKALYGAARRCYSRNNFADCEKVSECVDALIDAGIGDVRVAERALLLMARGECTFASPEFYKEEAEREVAKEEQIMANRCGEGKCEYFESTRRAANNNRENGYCKKYKQELHLYDWWWLKCDECTAEKKLAEEKK